MERLSYGRAPGHWRNRHRPAWRVYVSQLDDDLWSGGDTVTGGRCEDAHVHIGYEASRSMERPLCQRTLVFAYYGAI